jgi:hypothetical protein
LFEGGAVFFDGPFFLHLFQFVQRTVVSTFDGGDVAEKALDFLGFLDEQSSVG